MSAEKVMSANEEQGSRKSVRYIALSTLAHLGLLTMIAAMPRPQLGSMGQPDANATGSTVIMDISSPEVTDSAKLGNGGVKEVSPEQTALEAQASANSINSIVNSTSNPAAASATVDPVLPVEKTEPKDTVAVRMPVPQSIQQPAAQPTAPVPPAAAIAKTTSVAKSLPPAMKPKKSRAKIATSLPSKAGIATRVEEEDPLPEAVTWKATERAHEAALANQISESANETPAVEETESAATPSTSVAQSPADTAASDQRPAQSVTPSGAQSSSEEAPTVAHRQAFAAIPITTQAFAAAPAAQNGTGSGNKIGASGAAQLGAPVGTQFRNAEEMAERPGNKMPIYPMQDRVNGHQGVVMLVGQVAQDGHVAKATVQKSSGSIAMDQASMMAFRNWKFAPGQEGYVYKSFRFNLTGEAQEVPARLAQ